MQRASSPTASAAEDKIAEMVRRIVEHFRPEKVILFGSHARGTAGPDSDVDLLVVMKFSGSQREQRLAIRSVLSGIGMAKDVVVVTPAEVERYRDVVGTIIRPALREGRVLYERQR
jgi:predicted nucleotidyltransferase